MAKCIDRATVINRNAAHAKQRRARIGFAMACATGGVLMSACFGIGFALSPEPEAVTYQLVATTADGESDITDYDLSALDCAVAVARMPRNAGFAFSCEPAAR